MKGNLRLVGCGGAGINIAIDVYSRLKELEDTCSKVDIKLLDTTDKTIKNYSEEFQDRFTKIVSTRASVSEIDGTGSERKDPALVADIQENLKAFMDSGLPNNINDYYVIISSASGGSGSIINPLLTKAMLVKDYTVINIMVGDSSTYLTLNNTINTMVSINAIAKQTKTAIPTVFYDNAVNGSTTVKSEKANNNKIYKLLALLSVYNSGTNKNLDHEDMRKFYNPQRYKTFHIQPGSYTLGVAEKALTDEHTFLARTLISGDEELDIKNKLLHNKVGVISEENKELLSSYPNYLLYRKGIINRIVKDLKEELEKLEELKKTKADEFDMLDDAFEDDSGLLL